MKVFEHLILDITKTDNDDRNGFVLFPLRCFILWAGNQKSLHF